ncbi:N-acetylmuramoyl-L-alanine amidase [Alkalibacterium sp. AK22]|uniref:N-acetylglucosaminidase n=1 Tax=Alkalibacterium sp. AK22 TaxID=1229520 RepID=UPI0004534662|nr:N-acetylglucosaminidase [Alkalibacterium sp. AK22]EXJ23299.1 N-acetylmuramoyl-L-alanine amidase [Alkalibacterium sp. AK22]
MYYSSQRKANIKKIIVASMFASTILGAEQALAQESEPAVQSEGPDSSLENFNELIVTSMDSELSETGLSQLHKGISYHLKQQYEDAETTYSDLLDNHSLNDQLRGLIETLQSLSIEQVDLDEESINEYEHVDTAFAENLLQLLKATVDESGEDESEVLIETIEGKEDTEDTEETSLESDDELAEEEKGMAETEDQLNDDEPSESIVESEKESTDKELELEESDATEEQEKDDDRDKELKEEKEQLFARFSVQSSSSRPTAHTLYTNSINADTASGAWHYANELNKHYPNDYRITEAFEAASHRIFSLAQSNHRNRNYRTATMYYNQLLNQPHVPSNIKASLNTLITMANSEVRLGFASTYYTNTIDANTATSAWNAAMEYKNLYPTDGRLSEAVNAAGQRIFAMGRSSQRSNRFELALQYYALLLEEELLDQNLLDEALVRYAEVSKEINTSETDLFYDTINASSATEAWNNLGRLIARFPNHSRMTEAVDHASARIYAMGRSNHRSGRQATAQLYYSWLLAESRVNEEMRTLTAAHLEQVNNGWEFRTPEDYLRDTISAPIASEAWAVATEGMRVFPAHSDVQASLNAAADRIYALGQSNHRRGNFNAALMYYNQLVSHNHVLPNIKTEAQVLIKQAENRRELTTASQFYTQSMNAGSASQAWDIANEGLTYYPGQSSLVEALRSAADRVLSLGENSHKQGNFSTALIYYNRLLNNDNITHAMRTRVESYRYLATNHLYLTNMIIRESPYSTSFEAAVDRQMALRAKPQASHNGGWRNASREEVIRYMDPNNILPSDMSDLTNMFTTARIIVDVLNVRSGPGTSHSVVGSVSRGQEFTIIDEQSGWYKIGFNGSEAWISGSANHVSANREMLQFLNLQGSVGVSVENLNRELRNAGILEGQGAAFRQASIEADVNEIYLISHAILETGRGSSRLATGVLVDEVNGQPVTPRVVYNMFGIGAVDHAPVRLGAERAYIEGWFTPEISIIEGAKWISRSYVNHSTYRQNTLYKMRWNPAMPGVHQYATDVGWASKQTSMLRSIIGYSLMDNLILNFDIPKYQ